MQTEVYIRLLRQSIQFTITGSSGTGIINIGTDGNDYTFTFATDLSTTAANFVALYYQVIKSTYGIIISNVGSTLIFETTYASQFYDVAITNNGINATDFELLNSNTASSTLPSPFRRIELMNGMSIPITYQLIDIREPDKKKSNVSKQFKVPGTSINNDIFGHIFSIGVDNKFNPNIVSECYILQDTIETNRGVFQLKDITETQGEVYYDCIFFGGIDDFFAAIHNKKLIGNDNQGDDINFSDLNHTLSVANITDSWSNVATGSGYVYPLIDRYGKTTNGAGDWNIINWSINRDFFPAIYLKEYWDRIFKQAGKTYSSSFISGTGVYATDKVFKHLIIPFTQDVANIFSQDDINKREFRAVLSSNTGSLTLPAFAPGNNVWGPLVVPFNDTSTIDGGYDAGSVFNTTNHIFQIAIDKTDYYILRAKIKLHIVSGANKQNIRILIVDDTYTGINTTGLIAVGTTTSANSVVNGADITMSVYTPSPILCSATRFYYVLIENYGNSLTVNIKNDISYFLCEPQGKVVEGITWDMNGLIPQGILQSDFISSVCNKFNLFIDKDPNDANNFIIEPRDTYYQTSLVDWSSKLDENKGLSFIPMAELQGKRYIFKYKEDNDYWNDYYQKKYLLDGSSQSFTQQNIFVNNDWITQDKKIESVFSATPLIGDPNGDSELVFPVIKSSGSNSTDSKAANGNIRLLCFNKTTMLEKGSTNVPKAESWNITGSALGLQVITGYFPYAGYLNYHYDPDWSLGYGVPEEEFFNNNRRYYSNITLYNTYWKNGIEEIIDKDAEIVSGYFKLTPIDISTLSFRKTYFFRGQYWRLNKIIDYDITADGALTKCEFIKILNRAPFVARRKQIIKGNTASGKNSPQADAPISNSNNRGNSEPIIQGSNNQVPTGIKGGIFIGDNNIVAGGSTGTYNIIGSNVVVGSTQGNVSSTGDNVQIGPGADSILNNGSNNLYLPGITDVAVFDTGQTIASGNATYNNNLTARTAALFGTNSLPAVSVLETMTTSTSNVRGPVFAQYSTGTDASRIILRKARGTRAVPTTISAGDSLGTLMFEGSDGTSYLQMAQIKVISEGTIGTNRIPTALTFSTATNVSTSVLTEAVRIDSSQNVGIGITPPASIRLSVKSAAASSSDYITNFQNSNGDPFLETRSDGVLVVGRTTGITAATSRANYFFCRPNSTYVKKINVVIGTDTANGVAIDKTWLVNGSDTANFVSGVGGVGLLVLSPSGAPEFPATGFTDGYIGLLAGGNASNDNKTSEAGRFSLRSINDFQGTPNNFAVNVSITSKNVTVGGNAIGVRSIIDVSSATSGSPTLYGLYSKITGVGTSVNYGLYIDTISGGSTNYGLYQNGSSVLNYLNSPLLINTSSLVGSEKLNVNGNIIVNNNIGLGGAYEAQSRIKTLGTISAASGYARTLNFQSTLTAIATSDVLSTIYSNTTYNDAGNTGVSHYFLYQNSSALNYLNGDTTIVGSLTATDVYVNVCLHTNCIQPNGDTGIVMGSVQMNSLIVDNGSPSTSVIAINTTSPLAGMALDVIGSTHISDYLLIGTPTRTARLTVYGSGSNIAQFSDNSGNSAFVVDANRHIGINTTSLSALVNIKGLSTHTTKLLSLINTDNDNIFVVSNNSTDTTLTVFNNSPFYPTLSVINNNSIPTSPGSIEPGAALFGSSSYYTTVHIFNNTIGAGLLITNPSVSPGPSILADGEINANVLVSNNQTTIGTDLYFDNNLTPNNIVIGTTAGLIIGSATNQKIGFWNTIPIIQPGTGVASSSYTPGGGSNITRTDTFDGYTLEQVVKALRNLGLLQ